MEGRSEFSAGFRSLMRTVGTSVKNYQYSKNSKKPVRKSDGLSFLAFGSDRRNYLLLN